MSGSKVAYWRLSDAKPALSPGPTTPQGTVIGWLGRGSGLAWDFRSRLLGHKLTNRIEMAVKQ